MYLEDSGYFETRKLRKKCWLMTVRIFDYSPACIKVRWFHYWQWVTSSQHWQLCNHEILRSLIEDFIDPCRQETNQVVGLCYHTSATMRNSNDSNGIWTRLYEGTRSIKNRSDNQKMKLNGEKIWHSIINSWRRMELAFGHLW